MDSKRFFFYYFLYYFLVGAVDSLLFGLTWNAPYVNLQQQITALSNPASFLVAAQGIIPISGFFSIFAMFFSYLLFPLLLITSVLTLFGDIFLMIIAIGTNAFFFLPPLIAFFIGTVSTVAFAINLVFTIQIFSSGARSQ